MKVITPKFRVSFPNVFTAQVNKLSGKEEYSLTALFAKDADLTELKHAANAAITKKWGPDKSKWPTNLRSPFRDQGERKKEGALPAGYEEGAIFLNLKSRTAPGVVDEKVQPILDENQVYSGCYGRASINAYCYDHAGNRGVAFGLTNFQKMGDGEPLSGRSLPTQDFKPIESADTDLNSDPMFN